MEKSEARDAAESAGLTNSHKSDSQDICFVPDGDYTGFIRKFTGNEAQSGMFLDVDGNILGEHRGIINYTIGQRKGLGVSAGRPLYVVKKNTLNNTVVLGDEKDLYTDSLIAYDVNLISVPEITEPIRITAKTRYSQKEQTAVLSSLGNGEYLVQFEAPQRAVTSGQAVVFYDGDIVVGGGIIK
jgi:tRNA-specific 2-thiouridylase